MCLRFFLVVLLSVALSSIDVPSLVVLLGFMRYVPFRQDMIAWGEEKRDRDPHFFCNIVAQSASRPVWIVSDARRPTDIDFFAVSVHA